MLHIDICMYIRRFLDNSTAMYPSLTWAQYTPGVLTNRGFGVMDTKDMYYFLDAVRLLVASKYMTHQQHQQFQEWVKELTDWLVTHPRGLREMLEPNNHGTYYDLQMAALYAASNQLVKYATTHLFTLLSCMDAD
jgi:citrate synthase